MAETKTTQNAKNDASSELERLKAELAKRDEVLKAHGLDVNDPTVEARDEIFKILDKLELKQVRAIRKAIEDRYTQKRASRKTSEK